MVLLKAATRLLMQHFLPRTKCKISTVKTGINFCCPQTLNPSHRAFHCSSITRRTKDEKLRRPVDDVYLEDLYDPIPRDLDEAILTLKKNSLLDLTDQDSLVHLNLGLYLKPGKKKRIPPIHESCELPHPIGHQNKVCVFVEDADLAQAAYENGAVLAGSTDIVTKVLIGSYTFDMVLCTLASLKSTIMANRELMNRLGKLTPKKRRGVTEDLITDLIHWRDRTIISNLSGDGLSCSIIVAKVKQTHDEIKENILLAMEALREQQNPKHPPIISSGSISCQEDKLPFEIEQDTDTI